MQAHKIKLTSNVPKVRDVDDDDDKLALPWRFPIGLSIDDDRPTTPPPYAKGDCGDAGGGGGGAAADDGMTVAECTAACLTRI